MTGKIYLPHRDSNSGDITCKGTSDNIVIPVNSFRSVMDSALRLARSFDDGLSECGLICPPGVLALDSGNDPFYGVPGVHPVKKPARPSTKFPC
ncbi:unnamed protein product [Discosporangium mesarthrocarpum]